MKSGQDYLFFDSDDIVKEDEFAWEALFNDAIKNVDEFFGGYGGTAVLVRCKKGSWLGDIQYCDIIEERKFSDIAQEICSDCTSVVIGVSYYTNTLYCQCTEGACTDYYEFRSLTKAGYDASVGQDYDYIRRIHTFDDTPDDERNSRLWNSDYYSHDLRPSGIKWQKSRNEIRR